LISLGSVPSEIKYFIFIEAVNNNHLRIIKYLISLGTDPRAQDDMATKIIARNGYLKALKYFLSLGTDSQAQIDLAFGVAAYHGCTNVLKYLLTLGADPQQAIDNHGLGMTSDDNLLKTMKYLIFQKPELQTINKWALHDIQALLPRIRTLARRSCYLLAWATKYPATQEKDPNFCLAM
jgi:hypothetical protein